MADFTIYPENDFAKFVTGKEISSTTGAVTAEETGTVTAFFSTSKLPDATAADATLSVDCTFVAGKGWLVFFDRSVMDYTLLDGLFASATPYLIVDDGQGWWAYYTGEYVASRPGTVA
jgi:hypothetical protein